MTIAKPSTFLPILRPRDQNDRARRPTYCRFADAAEEVPTLFVRVALTDRMAELLPVTVNGWVNVNWLPKGADGALEYQGAKIELTGTASWLVCRFEPEVAENWNVAVATSREVA